MVAFRTHTKGRSTKVLTLGALLLLGGGVAVLTVPGNVGDRAIPVQAARAEPASLDEWQQTHPLGPGVEPSKDLQEAVQGMSFPVALPSDSLASTDTIAEVWSRPGGADAALAVRFDSGVRLFEHPAEKADYPTDEFYSELVQGLKGATLTEIGGAPAMVIEGSPELGNPSSADVIIDGLRVSLIGQGRHSEELLRIAESMIPSAPPA